MKRGFFHLESKLLESFEYIIGLLSYPFNAAVVSASVISGGVDIPRQLTKLRKAAV
jgi:hypothetical protein